MALGGHFEFCQNKMFRSGETRGLFTGNKGGHFKHILKLSALYYYFSISKPKIPGLNGQHEALTQCCLNLLMLACRL